MSKRSTIKVDDTIIICDAGGGTVDLISYEIVSVQPFAIKECVKGEGDLCGGLFLDEAFLELIKRKLPYGAWQSVTNAEQKKFLNNNWESGIKPQFQNQQRTWLVDLPESCQAEQKPNGTPAFRGTKRSQSLKLTSSEILGVFDAITSRIETVVQNQADEILGKYDKKPKYVILVGGFGRSRYLFGRVRDVAKLYGAEVLQSQGSKPWTAICRGAVIGGLTSHDLSRSLGVKVEARIARASYGIIINDYWDAKTHSAKINKFWCTDRQKWMVKNRMRWFLKQGEDIREHTPVRHDFCRLFDSEIDQIKEVIYNCTEYRPPDAFNSSVRHLCSVKWNQAISLETLPTWTNKLGKVFRELNFAIEMSFEGGTVEITVHHRGKRVAGRNVEVKFN